VLAVRIEVTTATAPRSGMTEAIRIAAPLPALVAKDVRARWACAAVSSVEPSSTTMTGR
jgi:hypothetical protein